MLRPAMNAGQSMSLTAAQSHLGKPVITGLFMHSDRYASSLDWQEIGRRRFLRLLTNVGAAAAVAPLVACAPNNDVGNPAKLLVLSPAQAATLAALAQAVLPSQTGFPTVEQAQVVQRMDEELWLSDVSIQEDMGAALSLMEWLPLMYGHWSRFSRLNKAQRMRVVQQCMESSIDIVRAVGTNLKLVSHFMYFGHASSWAAIGYDGPFQKLPPKISVQRKAYALRVTGEKQ
jgi:hypothetical protein